MRRSRASVDERKARVDGAIMSTLAEIEKAIAALPALEQRELYRHLDARFRGSAAPAEAEARPVIRRQSARGFPISKGSAPFTAEDVARIEGEA
jgi:hypothetical protein